MQNNPRVTVSDAFAAVGRSQTRLRALHSMDTAIANAVPLSVRNYENRLPLDLLVIEAGIRQVFLTSELPK